MLTAMSWTWMFVLPPEKFEFAIIVLPFNDPPVVIKADQIDTVDHDPINFGNEFQQSFGSIDQLADIMESFIAQDFVGRAEISEHFGFACLRCVYNWRVEDRFVGEQVWQQVYIVAHHIMMPCGKALLHRRSPHPVCGCQAGLRISQKPDSRFAKSRTLVSLNPGQLRLGAGSLVAVRVV
jgi:hypothetical protein